MEDILALISNKARLEILRELSSRPKSLRELAQLLGLTTQGVAKHLAALEGAGLVRRIQVNVPGSPVRWVYALERPVEVVVERAEQAVSFHIHVGAPLRNHLPSEPLDLELEEVDEEVWALKARLKLIAEREARAFRQLAELLAQRSNLIDRLSVDSLERLVVAAYLSTDPERELRLMEEHFHIARSKLEAVAHRLLGRHAQ
jgi:predicted transcriptional regulator